MSVSDASTKRGADVRLGLTASPPFLVSFSQLFLFDGARCGTAAADDADGSVHALSSHFLLADFFLFYVKNYVDCDA